MPFEKGNKHGSKNAGKTHPCYNRNQLKQAKWMTFNGECRRVAPDQISRHLQLGWNFGRTPASEETRRKQSEAGKRANNPSHFKPGHRTWNLGDKMPESAGIAMTAGRLAKYGVTMEEALDAKDKNLAWCSEHLKFEPREGFHTLADGKRATRCQKSHKKYSSWYQNKFAEQGGLCGICKEGLKTDRAFSVDHHHFCLNPEHTDKLRPRLGCECCRGLLCPPCNPKLGWFEGFLRTTKIVEFEEGTWEYKADRYLNLYKK